jgi:hypothetical protein
LFHLDISPGFCRLRSFTIKFDDDETGCRFSLTSFLLVENSASFADDHHERRNWTGNTQSISTAATAMERWWMSDLSTPRNAAIEKTCRNFLGLKKLLFSAP